MKKAPPPGIPTRRSLISMTLISPTEPSAPASQEKTTETGPRVLIIRSASRTFSRALESLKQEFPDGSLTVLASPEAVPALRQEPRVQAVWPLVRSGRMGPGSVDRKTRRRARRLGFDVVAVLYNRDEGRGYGNVERLAWSLGAREIRGYFPDGSFRRLTGRDILGHSLREGTTFGWVALNVLAAGFQLVLFGLAMGWVALKQRWHGSATSTGDLR